MDDGRNNKEQRSRTMKAIPSRDTSPERLLRRELRRRGLLGYRVAPKSIVGTPDIAYLRPRLAVFVDGCFWHGCPLHCRMPASNLEYWPGKIARNLQRDQRVTAALESQGWVVLRIWEHELKQDLTDVVNRIQDVLKRPC